MQHPFQCVATAQATSDDSLLIVARGPSLMSLSLRSGDIASEWTADSEVLIKHRRQLM